MIRCYTLINQVSTAERHLVVDDGNVDAVQVSFPLFDLLGDMVEAFIRTGHEAKLANVTAQLLERGELVPVKRTEVPKYVFVAQYFTEPKQSERRVRAAG